MVKQSKSQLQRTRKLNNTINRLAKSNGLSKQEVLDDLAIKLGTNASTASELSKLGGAKLTRILNDKPTYQYGALKSNKEVKAQLQGELRNKINLEHNDRKRINKAMKEAKQFGLSFDIDHATYNALKQNGGGQTDILDDAITQHEKQVSLVKQAGSMPEDITEAISDKRWGKGISSFDQHVLNNLLSGDINAYAQLLIQTNTLFDSAAWQYVIAI